MALKIALGTRVVVALGYPTNVSETVYASIRGEHLDQAIVQLDNSEVKIAEWDSMLPVPKEVKSANAATGVRTRKERSDKGVKRGSRADAGQPRESYDNSFRELNSVLKDISVETKRNDDPKHAFRFIVFTAASNHNEVLDVLTAKGYVVDSVTENQILCNPPTEQAALS